MDPLVPQMSSDTPCACPSVALASVVVTTAAVVVVLHQPSSCGAVDVAAVWFVAAIVVPDCSAACSVACPAARSAARSAARYAACSVACPLNASAAARAASSLPVLLLHPSLPGSTSGRSVTQQRRG